VVSKFWILAEGLPCFYIKWHCYPRYCICPMKMHSSILS